LAEWSCGQVKKEIVERGEQKGWMTSFDGLGATIPTTPPPHSMTIPLRRWIGSHIEPSEVQDTTGQGLQQVLNSTC